VVVMKSTIFWDIVPYLSVALRFYVGLRPPFQFLDL
jgi:hypothetical protein